MLYTEHQPSTLLGRHLECVWFAVDDDSADSVKAEQKVLPDGCIEWVFHLGDRFRRKECGEWLLQPQSFVVGEMTRYLILQPTGRLRTMGVRFRPGGAYRFLPFPVIDLTDQVVETGDIWGSEGANLEDAVLTASTDVERMRLVEDFLLGRLRVVDPRPRFEAAIAEVLRSHGLARVDDVATKVNWSPRQLEREFRANAGLTPKAMARIIRFQNLLRLIGENALREWATIAISVGYADQPHMVREFRAYAGQTPTEKELNAVGELARHFISPKRLATLLGGPQV